MVPNPVVGPISYTSGWGGLAQVTFYPLIPSQCQCKTFSPESPTPSPGLQGRRKRKVLARGLPQHWEFLAHFSDNHAVHLALGGGFLLSQDAPQCSLQVRQPMSVLQIGRGADHSMHQGEVFHAQLWEEQASSGTSRRYCDHHQKGTGHYCSMDPNATDQLTLFEYKGCISSTQNVPGLQHLLNK